jgi:hypothetical protein
MTSRENHNFEGDSTENSLDVQNTTQDRQAQRISHRVSVAYTFDVAVPFRKQPSPYRFGVAIDISERGMCFDATDRFPTGQMILLYLKLSDSTSGIKMLGKIVWAKPHDDDKTRVGIKFVGCLPPEWMNIILEN